MKKHPILFLAGLAFFAFFFRQGLPFGFFVAWMVNMSLIMLTKQEFEEYVSTMNLAGIKRIDLLFLATVFALVAGSVMISSGRPADFRSFWLDSLTGFFSGEIIYVAAACFQFYRALRDRLRGEKGGKERN